MMDEEKSEYFHQLLSLLYDVGTNVQLNVFKKNLPPGSTVESFLQAQNSVLASLRERRVLSSQQWSILSQFSFDERKIDSQLLFILIKNLQYIESPIPVGDVVYPVSYDKSVGAELLRLRNIHRLAVAHRARAALTKLEFENFWNEAKDSMLALATSVSPEEKEYAEENINRIEKKKNVIENSRKATMEQVVLSQEKGQIISRLEEEKPEYFFQMMSLIYDVGTDVVLKFVKKNLPPRHTIRSFLQTQNCTLTDLMKKRKISRDQFTAITKATLDERRFDLIRLFIVISILPNFKLPYYHWDSKVLHPSDMSDGACLMRIRNIRNEINHKSRAALKKSEFEKLWAIAEDALLALATSISPVERKNVEENIKQIKERGNVIEVTEQTPLLDKKGDTDLEPVDDGRQYKFRTWIPPEVDFKQVLRKCTDHLVRYMEPTPILRLFTQYEYLNAKMIRDIYYEANTTSKKNGQIIEKVKAKGFDGYKTFKTFLTMTKQSGVLQQLRNTESVVLGERESLKSEKGENGFLNIEDIETLCNVIKAKHESIIGVAASTDEDNIIHLTVTSESPKEALEVLQTEGIDEDIEVRKISEEGKEITKSKEYRESFVKDATFKEMNEVRKIISENAAGLTSPNIQSVSYCPVRSVGYGTNNPKIKEEKCILVLVDVKLENRQIPVGCIAIPDKINGVRTDIREGYVNALADLRTGHKVTLFPDGSNFGTLGPFIDMKGGINGFLTSLHVILLRPPDMTCCLGSRLNSVVYRPNEILSEESVGVVTALYYSKGDEGFGESGYEVALVRVHEKYNEDINTSPHHMLKFEDGETINISSRTWTTPLEKYGARSGYTTGQYTGNIDVFCLKQFGSAKLELYNQITVVSYDAHDNPLPFAEGGDSGSTVVTKENGKSKIVGIVTGWISDGRCVVTPIEPICNALKSQLKDFKNNQPMDVYRYDQQMELDVDRDEQSMVVE